ncbi:hypothetical protein AWJ20_582 [Sugiyamaella lignohabitans]|uniref:Letm1 RBD domain-containing protein n=1 Tax=Sugiyamaella lignohabitans TaxID=796027 RepID=A0A167D0M8_9ASCO|nr:uncharacterized protein AWJ20_582 [Sugiyamaella lignohabitans]ANB12332.1 hypothetical protein AWJ20_582 [Sugiyamaella lignohabitans]
MFGTTFEYGLARSRTIMVPGTLNTALRLRNLHTSIVAAANDSKVTANASVIHSWIYQQHVNSPSHPSKVNAPESLALIESVEEIAANKHNNVIGKILASGKRFVKLYKSGITNVYKNHKTCRALKMKYKFKNLPELTKYIIDSGFAQDVQSKTKSIEKEPVKPLSVSETHITRSEYMILQRTARDIRKVPLFAVVFAVFFETTPLLLMLFPKLAPSTCMSPSYIEKEIKKTEDKIISLKPSTSNTSTLTENTTGTTESTADAESTISNLDLDKMYSRSVYMLSRAELESLSSALVFPTSSIPLQKLYSDTKLRLLIKAQIDEIRADNILLSRFGSTRALDSRELRLACHARGVSITGKTDDELRTKLLLWMTTFADKNYDAGYFFA